MTKVHIDDLTGRAAIVVWDGKLEVTRLGDYPDEDDVDEGDDEFEDDDFDEDDDSDFDEDEEDD